MLLKAAGCIVSYWFEQMNYTYKKIWLIAFPVMMSILIEQLINITDALFLGHVGDVELGASALAGIWFLAIYMLVTRATSPVSFALRSDAEDKERVLRALKQANGNRKVAAELLGIGRTTLYNKLKEYGLKYKFQQP